jgi:hypothetical protein
MKQEFISAREVCKILGVSRTMVQKLMASGELERASQDGRLVFDRAKVEALAQAREVAKVQRTHDAEDREQREHEAELHRKAIAFDARTKSEDDQDFRERYEHSQARISNQLEQLRAKLQAQEEDAAHQRLLARLQAQPAREPTPSSDSYVAEALMILLPIGALLAIGYLDGKQKTDPAGTTKPVAGSPPQDQTGATPPMLSQERSDPLEPELLRKLREGTATPDEKHAVEVRLADFLREIAKGNGS